MSIIKIMTCLDMKDGRVVKGIHFVDLKDAGDPVENAAYYQQEGADELAMLDIAATVENRKTRLEWVKKVSSVIDIPLTVGGGISSLEDIELVLEAGADKISMNSAAVKDPDLVKQAATQFDSGKVAVAVDARHWGRVSSCRPVWTETAHRPGMIWSSPGPFPMPWIYPSLRRAVQERWSISTRVSSKEAPKSSWRLPFSIIAC